MALIQNLFAGGYGYKNTIEFWTVASLGNASDFGDLTSLRQMKHPMMYKIRVIWVFMRCSGNPSPTGGNIIQYVTIQTTGNAVDFGDTTHSWYAASSVNDFNKRYCRWYDTPDSQTTSDGVYVITIRTTGSMTDLEISRKMVWSLCCWSK